MSKEIQQNLIGFAPLCVAVGKFNLEIKYLPIVFGVVCENKGRRARPTLRKQTQSELWLRERAFSHMRRTPANYMVSIYKGGGLRYKQKFIEHNK